MPDHIQRFQAGEALGVEIKRYEGGKGQSKELAHQGSGII